MIRVIIVPGSSGRAMSPGVGSRRGLPPRALRYDSVTLRPYALLSKATAKTSPSAEASWLLAKPRPGGLQGPEIWSQPGTLSGRDREQYILRFVKFKR